MLNIQKADWEETMLHEHHISGVGFRYLDDRIGDVRAQRSWTQGGFLECCSKDLLCAYWVLW